MTPVISYNIIKCNIETKSSWTMSGNSRYIIIKYMLGLASSLIPGFHILYSKISFSKNQGERVYRGSEVGFDNCFAISKEV